MTGTAVLFPQQSECYAGLCQFFVDVGVIRFRIDTFRFVLVGEKECFQFCVGNIVIQWPCDVRLNSGLQYIFDRMVRTANTDGNSLSAVMQGIQPKNLTVIYFAHVVDLLK